MDETTSENFYRTLPGYRKFNGITDADNYRPVPDDWWVCVTDIRDSSSAIAEGRYRDINKIGAATITTVLNIPDLSEVPFTFGGDGAAVLVPGSALETVKRELASLRELAKDQFSLDLRAGAIAVREIRQANYNLEVAKFQLNQNQSIATFRGGGLGYAEKQIKEFRDEYSIKADPGDGFSLEGLSCRWKPIPNQKGTILSVLVRARSEQPEDVYRSILRDLDGILEDGLSKTNPIKRPGMNYRSIRDSLRDEFRYHDSPFSLAFVWRVLEIILAVSVFQFGLNPGVLDTEKYHNEMQEQSDHRKFDEMLRFIADCSHDEREAVESYLESRRRDGEIYYGLHQSENSLMTCYVTNVNDGNHIHFLDGSEGGYAMAAQQLKAQAGSE